MFSKRTIQNVESLVWRNVGSNSQVPLCAETNKSGESPSLCDNQGQHGEKLGRLLYAFRSFTLDTIICFTLGNCVNALDAPAFADPLIFAMDASLRALSL